MPQICVYFSEQDIKKIRTIARIEKRSISNVVRTLINKPLKEKKD